MINHWLSKKKESRTFNSMTVPIAYGPEVDFFKAKEIICEYITAKYGPDALDSDCAIEMLENWAYCADLLGGRQ